MPTDRVPQDISRIALDRAEGTPFERFAIAFYGALVGTSFVPLGGMKDGGADGFEGPIYEDGARVEGYFQASVEVDYKGKIRRTIKRLREFKRDPRSLVYLTSRTVKYLDRVERELTDELDVTITIRDGNYIALNIDEGAGTRTAFEEHLRGYTDFLRYVGASQLIRSSRHVKSPAVYVFLAHEIARRKGDESLVDLVTDALVLWALEGTDPDAGILRTAEEVEARIGEELPSVKAMVAPRVLRRLRAMGMKDYPGDRAVRWYRRRDAFCLPFETRRRIEEENTADEALRLDVLQSLDARLRDASPAGLGDVEIRQAAEVALRTLQLTFERDGLEFASFLRDKEHGQYSAITDSLRDALKDMNYTGRRALQIGEGAFTILRGVLYSSSEPERQYLRRLSSTYSLLFTLNTEPRLLEFFQDMAGDFYLYVGADQIVRALSEHFLQKPDQITRNSLLIAGRMGAKLVLTEPVLKEVVHHFRGADHEHSEHVDAIEHRLDYDIARAAPQIMLRAFLYARLNQELGRRRPRNWQGFVQQFCNHPTLHKRQAFDELRQYLQITFRFDYETKEDLESLVNIEETKALARKLEDFKSAQLARNDALLALAVYGRRKQRREAAKVTEFGWGTWWLTDETFIVKHTRDIVGRSGAPYIMRPDFLLNFLTLAPSAREAREAFASVFPSMLGIRLSRRMDPTAFNKIMDKMAEAESLDDGRRTVEMARLTNQLKSDLTRQYLATGSGRRAAAVDLAAERAEPADELDEDVESEGGIQPE